jgi:dephospho-CoA kinase
VGADPAPAGGLFVLGVTGGIGAGKSSVAAILARRGARVLDADRIVRELYEGGDLARGIAERFGATVLDESGAVDRPALARVVFASETARRDLERLVHPAVRARIARELAAMREEGFEGLAVVDAALLVEADPPYPLDALLVVTAPREIRLRRLEARGTPAAEAARRMAAQIDDARRIARADVVVENAGSPEDLERAVERALAALGRPL